MKQRLVPTALIGIVFAIVAAAIVGAAPPVPGAIFTTDSSCSGVNLNIYDSKTDVYLDGGPAHTGAAGLPDGDYYVKVTTPDGAVLGTSNGTAVTVAGGEFAQCYQLAAIVIRTSDLTVGYDDTTNPGGEYKVWVSTVSTFDNDSTKTDNFKVKNADPCDVDCPEQEGAIRVRKFYDADADGIHDGSEAYIDGWRVKIVGTIGEFYPLFTAVLQIVPVGDYTVSEDLPVEANWLPTTLTSVAPVSIGVNETEVVEFGNVCLGAGGGLTLGFWSNRNGAAYVSATDLGTLAALNLRNANGSNFDPTSYNGTPASTALRPWLLSGTAVNMSYMLSVQLAAMALNTSNPTPASPFVNASALVYAPGTNSANSLGFATLSAVMAEANTLLGTNGSILDGDPLRPRAEALKNALDRANNNLNFVQATPCAFSFAALE